MMADSALEVSHVANSSTPPQKPRWYGDVHISGNARVMLGDNYAPSQDLFEAGSETERRNALKNFLYYDGYDAKRQQLALEPVNPLSFSWLEKTSWPEWLAADSTLPFWFCGKPGSGKSILMKHLVESISTLRRLKSANDGSTWIVLHYFFDYRAGTGTANDIGGMLKSFVRQLCAKNESIANRLRHLMSQPSFDQHELCITLISDAMHDMQLKICAFIDGLDEFEGDYWTLATFLLYLRDRLALKLCLASRPEKAIESRLEEFKCPVIILQEHNKETIKAYVGSKVEQSSTEHIYIKDTITENLQNDIVERSQGGILWARLVLQELIKSADWANATTEDLVGILDSLPVELESMYERILTKINKRNQEEAALLLYLILEYEDLSSNLPQLDPVVLLQASRFLVSLCQSSCTSTPPSSDLQTEVRLKALLGNLIDLVDIREQRMWDRSHPYSPPSCVRLIHRSLSTYIRRGNWIQQRLPSALGALLPDRPWKRLALKLFEQPGSDRYFPIQEYESAVEKFLAETTTYMSQFSHGTNRTTPQMIDHPTLHVARIRDSYMKLGAEPRGVDMGVLARYCLLYFFELEPRTMDGQFEIALGLPQSASHLLLVHSLVCKTCIAPEWWIWWLHLRPCRLRKSLTFAPCLEAMHGRLTPLLSLLQSPDIQGSIQELDDVFDLVLVGASHKFGKPPPIELTRSFAQKTLYLQRRHLCALHLIDRMSFTYKFLESWKVRPHTQWLGGHDRDCPFYGSDHSLLRHWLVLRATGFRAHEVIELFFEALEGYEDVRNLKATMMQDIVSFTDKTIMVEDACEKFIAAAGAGACPRRTFLPWLRHLYRRHSWRRYWPYGIFIQRPMYCDFLEDAIKAVEYYESHAEQWPNLNYMLCRWRRDVNSTYVPYEERKVLDPPPRRPVEVTGRVKDSVTAFQFDESFSTGNVLDRPSRLYMWEHKERLRTIIKDMLTESDLIPILSLTTVVLSTLLVPIYIWKRRSP